MVDHAKYRFVAGEEKKPDPQRHKKSVLAAALYADLGLILNGGAQLPELPNAYKEAVVSSAQVVEACAHTPEPVIAHPPEQKEVTLVTGTRGTLTQDTITIPCAKAGDNSFVARAAKVGRDFCDSSYKHGEIHHSRADMRIHCGGKLER